MTYFERPAGKFGLLIYEENLAVFKQEGEELVLVDSAQVTEFRDPSFIETIYDYNINVF